MKSLIDFDRVRPYLKKLLLDRTTGKNILWATSSYEHMGNGYRAVDHMEVKQIRTVEKTIISPRVEKSEEEKTSRTKKRAEVFTPLWVVNKMINIYDERWFERKNVFNSEEEKGWKNKGGKIRFPKDKTWKDYVTQRCLEITCGEASFLVTRYEPTTGEIIPFASRTGILDRKLRIVNQNTGKDYDKDYEEWAIWTAKAFESVYGYEYQGDNLLLGRINLLLTYLDDFHHKWGKDAELPKTRTKKKEYDVALKDTPGAITDIISWNLWQMDGLTGYIPYHEKTGGDNQISFESLEKIDAHDRLLGIIQQMYLEAESEYETVHSLITGETVERVNPTNGSSIDATIRLDWNTHKGKTEIRYNSLKEDNEMKFDFIVGNPPYQEQISEHSDNASLSKQLFPSFVKAAIEVGSDSVVLITPSRWFTADAQDKSFIKLREFFKSNNHIVALHHYPRDKDVFPGVDIAGGVSYFLYSDDYEGDVDFYEHSGSSYTSVRRPLFEDGLDIILSMNIFVEIIHKVCERMDFISMTTLTQGRNAFGIVGKRSELEQISTNKEFDGCYSVRCAHEEIRYTDEKSITKNLDIAQRWKVFISKGNGGAGILNTEKAVAIVGKAYIGNNRSVCTDSLIPIGSFDTEKEAINLQKYLFTKFARFMIGILKVSQNIYQIVYRFVPVQDFTYESDIDWTKSIHEIDLQLYKKYNLSEEEIEFIETHVKEME